MWGVRLAVPVALVLALAACACMRPLFGGDAHQCARHDLDDHGPPIHDIIPSKGSDTPMFRPRQLADAAVDSHEGDAP